MRHGGVAAAADRGPEAGPHHDVVSPDCSITLERPNLRVHVGRDDDVIEIEVAIGVELRRPTSAGSG